MTSDNAVMRVTGLSLVPGASAISETINRREILGLAGLDGHGQAAFLEALAGVFKPAAGTVEALTENAAMPVRSLRDAARARIGYMPSNRRKNGIFPSLSVQDNFTIGNLARFSRFGWLGRRSAGETLESFRDDLSMVYANRDIPITSLSGGNQQKVLIARAMARDPEVMLLNDPTRGVDIQTRHTLYGYFRRAIAERGMTLVVLSTELDEILELCDRVIVFRDFGVSARLGRKAMTMDALMAAMFGQTQGTDAQGTGA
ncbi:ATP-binding cassette domain-containing protein [Hoeflea sp.]|uniref:ATP-binding cassette domain-containing protein n=1 Tax=Hoeflea sp. TaxID=1940281 RepID=UPI003B017E90